jgi:hypothetical protein
MMTNLAKANRINPTAVTKALAEHTSRVNAGWRASESVVIRDTRIKLIAMGL